MSEELQEEDNPQGKAQTGAGSDSGEYLYSMEHNPDRRHNQDEHRFDHAVASFIDQPLKLDDAMELSAHALNEPLQLIAEALDRLVLHGRLRIEDGILYPTATPDSYSNQINDIFNEDQYHLRPGNSPQEPLDVAAEGGDYTPPSEDEMVQLYESWLEIVRQHPEWSARLRRQPETPLKIDVNDPSATMQGLREDFQYDPASVRREDQELFAKFLEIDKQIEAYEKWQQGQGGGMSKEQALRAVARYKMLGGKSHNIGLVRQGVRLMVFKLAMPLDPGSRIREIGNELAYEHYGSGIETLTHEHQLELLERAEKQVLDEEPIEREAFDDAAPPEPDPEHAPSGWEAIKTPDGQTKWRSKDKPDVELKQPEAGF